jgi:mRNA interferase HigB
MRVISQKRLRDFWETPGHADSETPLRQWYKVTKSKGTRWRTPNEVKRTFGSADPNVRVSQRRTAVVFNIGGNKYRLVCAIDYEKSRVYVHRAMTHEEYDEGDWKEELT